MGLERNDLQGEGEPERLTAWQRRLWRASLTPGSLLSLDEAAEALPGGFEANLAWLQHEVEPTGTVGGEPVYDWADILEAVRSREPEDDGAPITRWRDAAEKLGVSADTLGRRRKERDPERQCYFSSAEELRVWWRALIEPEKPRIRSAPTRRSTRTTPEDKPVNWARLTRDLVSERDGS